MTDRRKKGVSLPELIDIDDKRFIGCKLTNCTLRVIRGGQVEWDKDTTLHKLPMGLS